MINDYSHIEDLIAKYLAGEAKANEQALLMQWRDLSKENYAYFETLERIFYESAAIKNWKSVDTDAAWNKLKNEIRNSGHTEKNRSAETRTVGHTERSRSAETRNLKLHPDSYRGSNFKLLIRIAAIFLFAVFATAVYFFFIKENIQTITIASAGESKTFLLPDSSSVFMNKNTTLAYTFSKNKREITLTGEAFFDVKHDASKQFTIHVNDLEIKDIGTKFNVKAINGSDSVEVMVESGEVKMTSSLTESLISIANLKPGEQAVFSKKTKRISKTAIKDTNALAYRTKVFVFENASLQAAMQKLTEVYGVEISLSDKIKNCHITSTFKNENIDAVINVIVSTLNLKLTKNESKYILEGDGCDE